MKPILLATLFGCATLLVGCETTGTPEGTQEAKHRAALERQKQPTLDETQANLWNAHEDVVDRDSNPLRAY